MDSQGARDDSRWSVEGGKAVKTLEEFRQQIEAEVGFVGIKLYSHNIIGLILESIACGYGDAEAHKAIVDFGLDQLGWSVKNGVKP